MSTIIWVLVIHMHGGYCAENVEIKFQTEQACMSALSGIDTQHSDATCNPKKGELK